MKAILKVVNVYSSILEETNKDILIEAEGKRYLGELLDRESRWVDEEIHETLYSEEVNGNIEEVIDSIIKIRHENNMKVYDSSKRTMAWWGYMNGLFEEHIEF